MKVTYISNKLGTVVSFDFGANEVRSYQLLVVTLKNTYLHDLHTRWKVDDSTLGSRAVTSCPTRIVSCSLFDGFGIILVANVILLVLQDAYCLSVLTVTPSPFAPYFGSVTSRKTV
jgi:hypothetical protein